MSRHSYAADWEPEYDCGTGVYATKHEPPQYVFYKADNHGRMTMRTCAYATREEAEAQMRENLARHEKHWREAAERVATNPNVVVIDGVIYTVGEKRSNREFSGFGGRQFYIVKHDGTMIETRNLWCGGEIPPEHRDALPDNAEFVNGERWVHHDDMSYLAEGA